MRPVCTYTDFFVIASGQNPRQTAAIYDEVRERLKKENGLIPHSSEGSREANWIVADYIDVVLHVFTPDARMFYKLEDLWGDVPFIEVEAAAV
jgi:ribosome-associated protein